ncbi:MAG: DUF3108 domain-containing protein [Flavobacteriales bacterium]
MKRILLISLGFTQVLAAQELPKVRLAELDAHPFPKISNYQPVFEPGEQLEYAFQFGFIEAASASIAITEKGSLQGRDAWNITVNGQTNGAFRWVFEVNDRYQSTIDSKTGLPLIFERDINEGGYELYQNYRFDWTTNSVRTEQSRGTDLPQTSRFALPGVAHDMVSGLYALRQVDWANVSSADTVFIPLFMDEEWFDLKLTKKGTKNIEVNGRHWDCIVIQPIIQTGRIWENSTDLTVYISNDGRHIPVLAETQILFGKIKMQLTNATGLRNL